MLTTRSESFFPASFNFSPGQQAALHTMVAAGEKVFTDITALNSAAVPYDYNDFEQDYTTFQALS